MYDKFPFIPVGAADECTLGWTSISARIAADAEKSNARVVCVEAYPGADYTAIFDNLSKAYSYAKTFNTLELFKSSAAIDTMLKTYLTDDPVFGHMNNVIIRDFFDDEKLCNAQCELTAINGLALVVGPGASLVASAQRLLIYADMARWELQLRQRRKQIGNLGADNQNERPSLKYKRAFFVDWRAADRLKQKLLGEIDLLLDTNAADAPKLIKGDTFRRGLAQAARRQRRAPSKGRSS